MLGSTKLDRMHCRKRTMAAQKPTVSPLSIG